MGWSTLGFAKAGLIALSIAYSTTTLAGPGDDPLSSSVLPQEVKKLLHQESPLAFISLRSALLKLSPDYQGLQGGRIGIAFSSTQTEAVDSIYDPAANVCVLNTGARESVAKLYKQIGDATQWSVEKVSVFIAAHEVEHCIVSSHIASVLKARRSGSQPAYAAGLAARALYPDGSEDILDHFTAKVDESAQANNRYNEAGSDMFAMLIIQQRFGLSAEDVNGVLVWRSKASDKSHDTSPWLREFQAGLKAKSNDLARANTFESASELSMRLVDAYRERINK